MKVVDPNNVTHSITLIPRFNTSEPLTLILYNEVTKKKTTVINTHQTIDGNMVVTYDFTFADKDRFQMKILDGLDVVYRGKLIATTQTTQEFMLNDGLYFFKT